MRVSGEVAEPLSYLSLRKKSLSPAEATTSRLKDMVYSCRV